MAINRSVEQKPVSVAEAQLARVAGEGSARHPHLSALLEGCRAACRPRHRRRRASAVQPSRPLSRPGRDRAPALPEGAVHEWLTHASEAFERERLYLVRLTSAVGPLPSTPGAAETEASLVAARHALETLATSERDGCALGAATALVCDWWPVRRLLDRAAARVGTEAPAPSLPDEASVVAIVDRAADSPGAPAHWRSAESSCCSSTAPCSTCSKPAPKPAATIKPPSRSSCFLVARHRPRPASRGCRCCLRLREEQARSEHQRAQREIGAERPHRAVEHARRERDAQESRVEPEILADRFAHAQNRVGPKGQGDLIFLRFHCSLQLAKSRALY